MERFWTWQTRENKNESKKKNYQNLPQFQIISTKNPASELIHIHQNVLYLLMRPMPARWVAIGRRDVQQASDLDCSNGQTHERRIAPKGVDIHQIKEVPSEITLRQYLIRTQMREHPPPIPSRGNPSFSGEVGEDEAPVALEGVVGPHEGRAGLGEVAEGADAAPAHGIEDAEAAAKGHPVEGGGQDAEVAADDALAAEEGVACLELDAPLHLLGAG